MSHQKATYLAAYVKNIGRSVFFLFRWSILCRTIIIFEALSNILCASHIEVTTRAWDIVYENGKSCCGSAANSLTIFEARQKLQSFIIHSAVASLALATAHLYQCPYRP